MPAKGKPVRIEAHFLDRKVVDEAKIELSMLAVAARAGIADKPTVCQRIVYHMLKEAGELK